LRDFTWVRYAGALSTAILWAEAAVQKDRAIPHGWELLGLYQAENEQEVQAITALQACVRADPARSAAHLALAVSFTNEMRFVETYVTSFSGVAPSRTLLSGPRV
jgi:hypothetical protein